MADLLTRDATVIDRFRAIASAHPGKPFIVLRDRPEPVTFAAAWARAGLFAAGFAASGVRPGQVVALMLPTHADAAPAFFGVMMAGAIPAFFPPLSPRQDAAIFWAAHSAVFARIDVALIVTDAFNIGLIATHLAGYAHHCLDIDAPLDTAAAPPALAAQCHDIAVPQHRHDIALLQHSSGTTGLKKGVALTHGMILDHVDAMADCLAITEHDVIASWLPLYHDMGLIACFIAPALLGLTVAMLDPFDWVRRPATLLDAIAEHRATLCWLPNFAFHHIMRQAPADAAFDLSSLRAVIDCSEPCKPATLDAFRNRFASHGLNPTAPQVCYAMAETVFVATQTTIGTTPRTLVCAAEALDRDGLARPAKPGEALRKILSCGAPMSGVRLRILDADGAACPDRRIGAIVISSDTLFAGYFRLPMPPGRLESGWYHTGDRGFLDQGELFVTGRSDDLLIINGKNIYAHDVEFCVNTHCAPKSAHDPEGIKPGRAVAIAPFNPQTGSQALVVIAESDETDTARRNALVRAIKDAINAEFAATAFEVLIVLPGALIKTTSGKLSRAENLARYVASRPLFQRDAA